MSSAVAELEWIDAETPHAKVLREEQEPPRALQFDDDIRAAIARVEAFQARLTREAIDQPLVVIEPA